MGCDLKCFFVAMLHLLISEYAVASTFPLALPNCTEACGDVLVPYPFGIGEGCYRNKWFEIVCSNASDQQPMLFFPGIQRAVTFFYIGDSFSISVYNKFYIQSPIKHLGCPNRDGDSSSSLNLTGSPFFISENNKFTAVGCNNKAFMNVTGLQIAGCETTCGNQIQSYKGANESCIGYKCCQMTIPPLLQLQVFEATVEKLELSKQGCQVAFLTQATLSGSKFTPPELPEYGIYTTMELEWRLNLSNMTSERVKCNNNTHLENSYQCVCHNGYEGNPYMPGGCQDIDECQMTHICGKNKCVNVPGSHRCVKTWAAILSGTLTSGLLLLVVGMWLVCKANRKWKVAKQKRRFFQRNGGLLLQQQTSFLQGNVNRTKLFSSNDLEKATDRFNASRILGQGGQGTVYKGMLEDGMIIAVKKSKALEQENLEEFINEIILLSQINH